VRALSQDLQINPNTAHKIVLTLIAQGLLEVRPGIGTTVSSTRAATRGQRRTLLDEPVERLVVEARRLLLDVDDLVEAVRRHWIRLEKD
jgi:GntR family transcriptional regulator